MYCEASARSQRWSGLTLADRISNTRNQVVLSSFACRESSKRCTEPVRRLAHWRIATFVVSLLMMVNSVASEVEIKRLSAARSAMPELAEQMALFNATTRELWPASSVLDINACRQFGLALWQYAKERFRTDDRLLYWQRISTTQALREHPSLLAVSETERSLCLSAFEHASRGREAIEFREGHLRFLISGFDPFLLDQNIEQSNPSGLVALRLDDQFLQAQNGEWIHVRAVIFPVRFQDFDDGVVEALLEPLLRTNAIDAFVSVSMGRDAFDLERFPGRRRSASALDNANRPSGGSEDQPLVPLLLREALDGAEFLEFSLPAERMREAPGRWDIRDNRTITSLELGTFSAEQLSQLSDQTAVRGSGGGYLSNEIAYRALNVRDRSGSKIPMGHIHTPRMSTFDPEFLDDALDQIKEMLIRLP